MIASVVFLHFVVADNASIALPGQAVQVAGSAPVQLLVVKLAAGVAAAQGQLPVVVLPGGQREPLVSALQGALNDLLLLALLALEGMGQVDADCVVFLEAQLGAVVCEGDSLGEVAEFLEDVLIGLVEVDEGCVSEVDKPLEIFDISDQSLEEVVDIWLEND